MTVEHIRKTTNAKLNPKKKSELGQFMTPSVIAEYMASLFDDHKKEIKLIDCGAGIGSLTISAAKKLKNINLVDLWEIDPIMQEQLEINMHAMKLNFSIYAQDFILGAVENIYSDKGERYTHAIINPPYKKINSNSEHRRELRKVGIETVNLYSAFVALTIQLMEQDGQIVAIIPRSFCNGPYYKPFRELILKECSIEHIHIFESRDMAFKDDDVLQDGVVVSFDELAKAAKIPVDKLPDEVFKDLDAERNQFDEDTLQELADSIKQYGMLQPILVTPKDDFYEIIAGERRWRAAKQAGLNEVPVMIRKYNENEIVEIALIENIQRDNLNPIEEAMAYKRLMEEFELKQDEVATKVSKSRASITNSLRLLKLDPRKQKMLEEEMISTGHARALLAISNKDKQYEIAQKVFDEKLSVRDIEKLVKDLKKIKKNKKEEKDVHDFLYTELEESMKQILGSKVSIKNKKNNKGKIEIEYYSRDELERIVDMIRSI